MLELSGSWQAAYPGAAVGLLAMSGVANPEGHPLLERRRAEVEALLRSRYAGLDRGGLKALPILRAYAAYYKRFDKTYHVLHQLESVALQGKAIPRVAALVEAMFMAELKNLLLTAGHDLEIIHQPVRVDVSDGSEQYTRLNGQEQVLKRGDMFIADAQGVISSIIYGPDRRTQITPATRQALFTVYAPPGIERQAVQQHLQDIQSNVMLIAPQAKVVALEVYGAG